jgi:RsiW-degrading membrane proteinase PrsW (M82 family)
MCTFAVQFVCMDFFSLLALALAPGVAIGLYIYLKDRHEREPLLLLVISFLYGALSAILTLVISYPINILILTKEHDVVHQFVNAFFKIALIEEFCKFIFVRFILFYNKNFNEPFDGIVYAVMVSMGFATLENVLYTFQSGFMTGVLRLFTAVPAHATFGVMMGFFLGKAKFTHRQGLLMSLVALAVATLFHGMYDYFWFISYLPGIWLAAIASLLIGFVLSRKAIRLHQQASPFIEQNHSHIKEDKPEPPEI